MSTPYPDMQNSHIRGANSSLSFCTATNYFDNMTTERSGHALRLRHDQQESETTMSLKTITGWFDTWKRYRVAVRELSQLSDRELADLGIQRNEIDMVARQSLGV